MANRARSSAPPRHSSKSRHPASTADKLAKDLADKLTINNDKGKQKGREDEFDSEARKLASMRAVNGASQTLSNVAQSGWKKLTGGTVSKTTLKTVISCNAEAAKHLGILRRISPGDIDIERAALSVLGKLLVLEMYNLAFPVLEEMYPRICLAINNFEEHRTADPSKLYLLSVPKAGSPPSNPTVLNLLSTYLLYALILVSRPESSTPSSVQQLSTTLDLPSTFSLLSWLPDCSVLPSKHLDSLLTRAYTALTRLCNSSTTLNKPPPNKPKSTNPPISTPSPEALFRLRVYALRCLAYTSTGAIEGKIFWDQATKFASALVKATPLASSSTTEGRATLVLRAFDQLVQIAETRSDKEIFMAVDKNGENFIAFCDYWSSFAKRAGDISLLQRINALIQNSSPSSNPFTPSPQKQVEASSNTEAPQRTLIIDGTKLCNLFAQLSILLEDLLKTGVGRAEENDDQLLSLIRICTSSLEPPSNMTIFLRPCSKPTSPSSDAEEHDRICAKVDRAVEKVRRVACKALDIYTSSQTSLPTIFPKVNEHLHPLLRACVACLQVVLLDSTLSASAVRDILHRSIDTLFVMARITLRVTDPRTFIPAFELLTQATSILNSILVNDSPSSAPREESLDLANYARCISGAFYNLASILYQGTRYGNAVPFLLESCTVGERALSLPRSSSESITETRRKEWTQLEEQLYRRWELLGVCYSKNSDRRKAFDAFKQAIATFPFSPARLSEQTDALAMDALFGPECTTAVKQLVGLVDRVTYMGTCELFLPPEAISFRSCMRNTNGDHKESFHLENGIIGVLLERQLVSLEPSRWKEGVRAVFVGLLRDALEIYSVQGDDGSLLMPIRKARMLCRCLEFAYRDPAVDGISSFGCGSVEEVATEIERLCTLQSFAKDSSLAHFSLQYRATAQLWLALHAHRRGDPEQNTIMTQRSEQACQSMKMILAPVVVGSPKISRGPTSPKLVRKSAGSVGAGRVVSPKAMRTNRLKVPSAPRKPAPVRKAKTKGVAASNAVKPKTKLVTATNAVRRSLDGKTSAQKMLIFDNFDEFLNLLQLVARILGLLSLVLAKAHILDMARKLAHRHVGTKSDGYILASLDLAHEYVTLGKLRRAVSIFRPAHDIVKSQQASREVSVRFLLRFGESLAIFEDTPKSLEVYLEAQGLMQHLNLEEKGMSTRDRVIARVKNLEIAATAAHVFAIIQFAQGDVCASLGNSLQALRLWNRAIDTLTRLRPSIQNTSDDNPFEMTSLQNALPSTSQSTATPNETRRSPSSSTNLGRSAACELEWSLSEGLLSTLFFLSETYFLRGSAREAEYFARQAAELAEQLNLPAMTSRALAKLGEVQIHMGRFEDAHSSLGMATDGLQGMPGLDAADIRRLKMEYRMKTSEDEEPMELFEETVRMLEDLDDAFQQFDSTAFGSLGSSPGRKVLVDVLAPALLSSILSQQLWLLRNDIGDRFDAILERFLSLSFSNATKAEENALMANLTLHSVYGRFRTDMFLSSLTESTIAVPIGMKSRDELRSTVSSVDILDALVKAEKHLSAHLRMSASTGSIIKIRETVLSLALVHAFGTSLGDQREDLPSMIASLLDASAALTLRHDMLDAIDHKFPLPLTQLPGEFQWPSPQTNETPSPSAPFTSKIRINSLSETDDDDDDDDDSFVKEYWQSLRQKYKAQILDPCLLPSLETATLPNNWTVVNVSVTPDKSTLFCCRREGGDNSTQPLIFCIPLKERREHGAGDGEGEHLTFDGALSELQDIIHSSNESTKDAIHIKPDDETARSNWWKQRGQLDVRMRELLENIEYCWLGAFKTIFSRRSETPAGMISELREQFEKVFHQNLRMKDKKPAKLKQRKCTSQTYVPGQFRLDEAFVKCFSTLSSKCRDEELEDIIYFVLDLYQYHGVPVAVSEVDIDQLVVDLRTVLEEYAAKQLTQRNSRKITPRSDDHLFLILDKNVQGIPWESLPILRGRSVSRIPGVQFLHDRILFAQRKREVAGRKHDAGDGAVIDHRNGFFILNPSGDLTKTEDRFRDWANGMRKAGWDGITGQPITEQQFIDALRTKDLVIYFGHGGGEQYVRSHRIRNLPTCAATMLWGCSSGALRDLGDFDRTGTPYNYMLAGCPTLVANLWDVTDKDIDKLCQSVLNKMSLNGPDMSRRSTKSTRQPTSLVSAVAESRDSCKLKYLTGAAPVVYGIPFYL